MDYYRALMCYKGRIAALTDEQIYQLFLQTSQNIFLSLQERSYADYYRAMMGRTGRTTRLSNAEIYLLLCRLSYDNNLSKSYRYHVLFLKVKMKLDNKGEIIENGENIAYIDNDKDIASLASIHMDTSVVEEYRTQAHKNMTALLNMKQVVKDEIKS